MLKKRTFTFGIVIVVLLLTSGLSAGQALRRPALGGGIYPASNPWTLETVASLASVDLGQHAAIAFHKGSDKFYISHYDVTNEDLLYVYPVTSGGNCGTDNAWYCETIDSAGDVGSYSSLDHYHESGSNTSKTGIAYYDADNSALKVAIWSCPTVTSCAWRISTIQKGLAGVSSYGTYTSLKFDTNGDVHVSYYHSNSINDDGLMYTQYVGSGGNCGVDAAAGKWQCTAVINGSDIGSHTSMDLTSNDVPFITYYDFTPGELRLCDRSSGAWLCRVIESVGGGFSSVGVDSAGQAHIGYYNRTDGTLRYAKYVGLGSGNCGPNPVTTNLEYRCEILDSIGADVSQVGIALVVDSLSYPLIAYKDAADSLGYPTLNIARPMGAYGQLAGNCGPIPVGGIAPTWQCDVIDNATQGGGAGYLSEADYVSVDVDTFGLASIAYYEYDDYNNVGRLKMAAQHFMRAYLPLIVK